MTSTTHKPKAPMGGPTYVSPKPRKKPAKSPRDRLPAKTRSWWVFEVPLSPALQAFTDRHCAYAFRQREVEAGIVCGPIVKVEVPCA